MATATLDSWAAVNIRKAGYDALIIEGKASKPVILHIKDKTCEFLMPRIYGARATFDVEEQLRKKYSKLAGIVSIGPAGENLVKFATVVSQNGRAGGRPGMGAVMGSKNLKAIVVEGTQPIPLAYPEEMKTTSSRRLQRTSNKTALSVLETARHHVNG